MNKYPHSIQYNIYNKYLYHLLFQSKPDSKPNKLVLSSRMNNNTIKNYYKEIL